MSILFDTIEALQQENNGWRERYDELDAGHSRLFKDFCKLQQENEQLQAQVAQYREALIIANYRMPDVGQFCACGKCKTCGADINYAGYEHCVKCARVIIDEALSDTPADYHNPADVEALRKAREAIKAAWSDGSANAAMDKANKALAEIDKAIGGKEDV
jgi:FtsZ-binding cell division protein ZapB